MASDEEQLALNLMLYVPSLHTTLSLPRGSSSQRHLARCILSRGFSIAHARPPPPLSASQRAAPAADPSGKWQHDLFSSSSSLYNPVVNLPALASRGLAVNTSSASLRPFGAATPAPQIYTNQQARVTAIPTGPAAMQANGFGAAAAAAAAGPTSLTERLGIKGRKNSEAVAERQRQQAIAERERKEKADLQRAAEARNKAAIEARRLAEANWNRLSTIAKEEDMGFVVQVEGLVYGTSADDVQVSGFEKVCRVWAAEADQARRLSPMQTAFSAYGDTSFCFVLNELTATETDDLIARLTFKVHADAVDACTKLKCVRPCSLRG